MSKGVRSGTVVILHGICMSAARMAYLNFRLRREGFDTRNISYPSRSGDIDASTEYVEGALRHTRLSDAPVHFVTHSMGSLIALKLIARQAFEPGRAVLLAPPYKGSEVADMLHKKEWYKRVFGPAGGQLTTAYRAANGERLPEGIEIGVVAGTRIYECFPFRSMMEKTGPHDGVVSVESTAIPGMKDHITLRMSHTFLPEQSVSQTMHFLHHGCFNHGS